MTLPYVYRLTDNQTSKRYIGCRMAEGCFPEELGGSYFSSSELVEPLFRQNPARFEIQVIVTGSVEYVYNVETSLLQLYSAATSDEFYNMHNNDNLINPVKAAMVTVVNRTGVHARTKEQMTIDSSLMLRKHLKAKTGMFSYENMKKSHAVQKERGVSIYSEGAMSRGGISSGNTAKLNKTGIHSTNFDKAAAAKKMHLTKYKCAECDLKGAATSLALHQKASKHVGKILIAKG